MSGMELNLLGGDGRSQVTPFKERMVATHKTGKADAIEKYRISGKRHGILCTFKFPSIPTKRLIS